MSVQVRRRREAASFLSTYVGAQGELLVDTTNNRVQVHDGVTAGGWAAARLLDVAARTQIADANYSVQPSDRLVAFTSLTAPRVVTLPAASAYPIGFQLAIADESGACSATSFVTITAAGSDSVNGLPSVALTAPFAYVEIESNGSGKWTILGLSASTLFAPIVVNTTGSPITPPSTALLYTAGNMNNIVTIDAYGVSGAPNPAMVFRAARGPAAAPSGLLANDTFTTFGGRGYGATGFSAATNAAISFRTTQAFTDTAQGAAITFLTTPNNATAKTEAMRVDQSGYLGIGTTTPQAPLDVVGPARIGQYTVAALPTPGLAGRMVFATNGRMFNGGGTLEASGAGTGGLVIDNGTAWKIAGTNVTVSG